MSRATTPVALRVIDENLSTNLPGEVPEPLRGLRGENSDYGHELETSAWGHDVKTLPTSLGVAIMSHVIPSPEAYK